MPTPSTFYLNGPTLDTANAVFLDSSMNTCAPDGFYSDGYIVRQQVGCVLLPVQSCPNCIIPVTGLTWSTTVNNTCNPNPWVIGNQNLTIRYNIVDSSNCGGTCSATQSGTATATITVGANNVNMGLSFNGIGELKDSDYEKIKFKLDGVEIASAHAAGGNLGCAMGPVVQSFTTYPPYLLLAGSVHTLFIDFTTNDGQYHVGAFYEANLSFVEIL